ncbi:MAG TPA: SBBP repeat-containing protein [Thermoleophilaceae bacterium]
MVTLPRVTSVTTAAALIAVLLMADDSGRRSRVPPAIATAAAPSSLAFEANGRRTDPSVDFLARGRDWTLFLTPRGSVLRVGRDVIRSRLVGARHVRGSGESQLPGKVNSLIGSDPAEWRTRIPTFGRIRYRSVYPGTDLVYYGHDGKLEYDFVLAPGAAPGRIALEVDARRVRLDRNGDLLLGPARQHRPVAYQRIEGERRRVDARFVLDGRRVHIRVGAYDRTRPLVIDPVLGFSRQLGGNDVDRASAVALDPAGNAYVTGNTTSSSFPVVNALDPDRTGVQDVVITKLDPNGIVVYSTLLGGSGGEAGSAIAVDATGAAHVTGSTNSTDFPHPNGAESTLQGASDAFVVRLAPDGSSLTWGTYLGGTDDEQAYELALDSTGDVHVVGSTQSTDFFVTSATRYQGANGGMSDVFVTRLHDTGGSLSRAYSTYLGGTANDVAHGVVVDSSDNTHVVGMTASTDFPIKSAPVGGDARNGQSDALLSKLDTTPTVGATTAETRDNSLLYSRYIGGSGNDSAQAIDLQDSNKYIVGYTSSNDLGAVEQLDPPFNHQPNGDNDGFMAEMSSDTIAKWWYLGGTGSDLALDVDVVINGASAPVQYVTGSTDSENFPLIASIRSIGSADDQLFALKRYVSADPEFIWSTLLGGPIGIDAGSGIAVDARGRAYVAGSGGADFLDPLSYGGGSSDLTVSRIDQSPPILAPSVGPADGAVVGTTAAQFIFTLESNKFAAVCNNVDAGRHITPNAGRSICSDSQSYSNLADGQHVFEVVSVDHAGDTSDPAATRRTFVVDTQPPGAFDLSGPDDGATTSTRPTLSWTPSSDAQTAVTYDVLVDDQAVQSTDSSACSGGSCSATLSSPLVTGPHTWKVRAKDTLGHPTDSASSRRITVVDPPAARMTIAPNPALVARTVTFDGSASADATHAIAKYEWDLDGDGSFERDTGASATTTHAYTSARTVNVSLRVTDTQGSTGSISTALRISSGGGTANLLGVTINRGAQYTRTPDVTVTATFPPGTTSIVVSNDGGFLKPLTFGALKEIDWKLDSSGPERLPKTIYVRFFTGPFPSETFQDDVILDETPPKVTSAQVTPSGSAAGAVRAAQRRARAWRLRVKATDSNSGVARIQATPNKRKPGRLVRYKRKLTVRSAKRPKWVRARDRAGNYSRWRAAR